MKKSPPNRRIPVDDHLSPGERSLLNSMKRRTIAHPTRSTSKSAPKRKRRRSLAIAALALSFAAAAPLRAIEPTTATQLLDRAQAESKAGQTAPAILDYERAQWLAPRNAAITNQLANLRAQAGLLVPTRAPLSRATHALSFDALTALASISFLLFALLVFGTCLLPASFRALSRKAAAGFGAIVILAATSVAARWSELHRAVITADNPSTHIAPADSSAKSFALKPGDIVHTGKTYGPFVRISSPEGQTAWIRQSSVNSIISAERQ